MPAIKSRFRLSREILKYYETISSNHAMIRVPIPKNIKKAGKLFNPRNLTKIEIQL